MWYPILNPDYFEEVINFGFINELDEKRENEEFDFKE